MNLNLKETYYPKLLEHLKAWRAKADTARAEARLKLTARWEHLRAVFDTAIAELRHGIDRFAKKS